jgi:hypothetical protein
LCRLSRGKNDDFLFLLSNFWFWLPFLKRIS